jgi:hypothetical protein
MPAMPTAAYAVIVNPIAAHTIGTNGVIPIHDAPVPAALAECVRRERTERHDQNEKSDQHSFHCNSFTRVYRFPRFNSFTA